MSAHKTFLLILSAISLLGVSTLHAQETRTYVEGRSAVDKNVPPYSGAVRVGETLYLAGRLGDENGKIPDDPAEEAQNVMNAIKRTLKAANMTMDDLVYVQIFCSDVSYYKVFNDVYRTYFTREYPARSFIGSGTLLLNARFEVQGIAVKA